MFNSTTTCLEREHEIAFRKVIDRVRAADNKKPLISSEDRERLNRVHAVQIETFVNGDRARRAKADAIEQKIAYDVCLRLAQETVEQANQASESIEANANDELAEFTAAGAWLLEQLQDFENFDDKHRAAILEIVGN